MTIGDNQDQTLMEGWDEVIHALDKQIVKTFEVADFNGGGLHIPETAFEFARILLALSTINQNPKKAFKEMAKITDRMQRKLSDQ